MKAIALALTALFATAAFADQKATWTCTGPRIKLEERSPYLGEQFEASAQSLWVLKNKDQEDDFSYTAFFLKVTKANVGSAGAVEYKGSNEVRGSFKLSMGPVRDLSDGSTYHLEAQGTLSYNHGPLRGQERVKCVME